MKNLFFIAILIFFFSSCTQQPVVDLQAEGEQVMETSRQWAKSQSNDELLSYWTSDAIFIAPKQPTLRGHEQILKMLESEADIPGFEVDWEPQEVFVSKSGDLAYLIENLSFAMNDSLGNQMKTFNKVVTIWKKQEDGSWKCVVDTFNEDPALTAIR